MPLNLTYPEGGALIVGGTGRVGEGVVRSMARTDVPIVFTYRGGNGRDGAVRAATLERELRDAGHDVTARQMDMANPASIRAAFDAIIQKAGRLHSVLCAAGPVVPFRRIADFTPEEIEAYFRGDSFDYFRLYREAVLLMRESGSGSICSTTTMANTRVVDFDGISAVSKAAVDSLTRQIAAEEGLHGIRCNAVAIGWVQAETIADAKAMLTPAPPLPPVADADMGYALQWQLIERARLGRNARPEEAGYLFAFLASDQAAYITGQTILFDGGTTL